MNYQPYLQNFQDQQTLKIAAYMIGKTLKNQIGEQLYHGFQANSFASNENNKNPFDEVSNFRTRLNYVKYNIARRQINDDTKELNQYIDFAQKHDFQLRNVKQQIGEALRGNGYIMTLDNRANILSYTQDGCKMGIQSQIKNYQDRVQLTYAVFISNFSIWVDIVFLKNVKERNFEKNKSHAEGGGGQIHISDNGRTCYKLKRLSKLSTDFSDVRQAIKQCALYKLFSKLQTGPQFIKTSIPQSKQKFDLVIYDNCVIFQMQLCRTVQDKLQNSSPEERQKLKEQFQKDIGFATIMLHVFNIMHRDIKPENVVYRQSIEKFVLIDYGGVHAVLEKFEQKTRLKSFIRSEWYCSDAMKRCDQFVNLYYNDYFCFKKSCQKIKKISGKSSQSRKEKRKDKQQYIHEDKQQVQPVVIKQLRIELRYLKLIYGYNYQIQLMELKLQKQSSNNQQICKKNHQKIFKKYKENIQQNKQFQETIMINKIINKRRFRMQSIFEDMYFVLSQKENYQQIVMCFMRLKTRHSLLNINFTRLQQYFQTIFRKLQGRYYSKNKNQKFQRIYFKLVQDIFKIIDSSKQSSQLNIIIQEKSFLLVQKLQQIARQQIRHQELQKIWQYLQNLSIFCCHFDISIIIQITINFIKLIGKDETQMYCELILRCLYQSFSKQDSATNQKLIRLIGSLLPLFYHLRQSHKQYDISTVSFILYMCGQFSIKMMNSALNFFKDEGTSSVMLYCSALYTSILKLEKNHEQNDRKRYLKHILVSTLSLHFTKMCKLSKLIEQMECNQEFMIIKDQFQPFFQFMNNINVPIMFDQSNASRELWLFERMNVYRFEHQQSLARAKHLKQELVKQGIKQFFSLNKHYFSMQRKIVSPLIENTDRMNQRCLQTIQKLQRVKNILEQKEQMAESKDLQTESCYKIINSNEKKYFIKNLKNYDQKRIEIYKEDGWVKYDQKVSKSCFWNME